MQVEKTTIYFRTDGNTSIGLGHFFRSLALADMLKEEFDCIFILQNTLDSLKTSLEKANYKHVIIPIFTNVIEEAIFLKHTYLSESVIIVLDGYQFNLEFQSVLKQTACSLIYITDFKGTINADLIINQAGDVASQDYPNDNNPIFCLGPKYALLQQAFLPKNRKNPLIPSRESSVFISMGGSDEHNRIAQILSDLRDKKVRHTLYVVLGSGYLYKDQLLKFTKELPQKIILLYNLTAAEMSYYMQQCSEAICTPSTVAYEYLGIGGNLYLEPIADNQKQIYQFLIKNELAFSYENYGKVTIDQKRIARQNQSIYFDGCSDQRLLKAVRQLDYQQHNAFRKTEESDFLLYHRWVNDSATRQFSINKDPIDFETHDKWFAKKIANPNCYMYVLAYKKIPIGQIRFEVITNQAKISYSLDKAFRGRGLGGYLLEYGIQQFQREYARKVTIIGAVFKQNQPSVGIFRRLGFQVNEVMKDVDLLEYRLKAS